MLGVTDRWLHDLGQRQFAVFRLHLAPRLQRSRHTRSQHPRLIQIPSNPHVVRPFVRQRREHIHSRRRRCLRVVVDYESISARQTDIHEPRAIDSHLHRLHHAQREHRRHCRINRITARGQHLCTRSRTQGVRRTNNPTVANGWAILKAKRRWRIVTPSLRC